jgi:succinate dehydrogenase/fumarate reductase iron-sulfur protein
MKQGEVNIFRYNPEEAEAPHYETYYFPFTTGMTILDVLLYVRNNTDSRLGFSYCCRNGHCGLCGVIVDGTPCLACRESAKREMTIEPLSKQAVIRDLIVEQNEYSSRIEKLKLFLCREQEVTLTEPEFINMQDFARMKVASRCVECKCCDAACSLINPKADFLGPSGFVLLARHFFDPRDTLERSDLLKNGNIEQCIHCRHCSKVCPHNIDPEKIIREMQDDQETVRRQCEV